MLPIYQYCIKYDYPPFEAVGYVTLSDPVTQVIYKQTTTGLADGISISEWIWVEDVHFDDQVTSHYDIIPN